MRARRETRALVEQILQRAAGFDGEDIDVRLQEIPSEVKPETIRQSAQLRAAWQFEEGVADPGIFGWPAAEPAFLAAARFEARWPLRPLLQALLDQAVLQQTIFHAPPHGL